MSDTLIERAAALMTEQTAAYRRLDAACAQLIVALTRGAPESVESLTRAGEAELLRMRARLVEIIRTLAEFADRRAAANSNADNVAPAALTPEARRGFEQASSELLGAAQSFDRTRRRAAALAANGSTFAATLIETCGVQPMTYRAPYARRGFGAR